MCKNCAWSKGKEVGWDAALVWNSFLVRMDHTPAIGASAEAPQRDAISLLYSGMGLVVRRSGSHALSLFSYIDNEVHILVPRSEICRLAAIHARLFDAQIVPRLCRSSLPCFLENSQVRATIFQYQSQDLHHNQSLEIKQHIDS